ncbi:MAG: hypothetical protein A2X55_10560 [Nitrospirae bacterium GWB2_47_37]|nr:MAG: hypothetical protein A2X55_10560 [Nitrospirae bacterium GWB2_47_37]HAK89351.1 hypothetical protein [Nitrospiraceae bacterium]
MRNIWKRLSIRHKITSIIVLTVVLVIVTILPVVSYMLKDALSKQQQGRLTSVKNLVLNLFDDYQGKVTGYAGLFSNDREIKDTLFYHTELAGEREHPLRAVTRLYKSFGIDSVEVGDRRGRVIAVAENPDRYDSDRSSDMLIKNALRGRVASGIELAEKGFIIRASAPVYYNESQLIGTITAGILLDNRLLSKIKELSSTDIIITDNKNSVVSSTYRDKASLDQEKHLIMRFPLNDVSGNGIGNVLILQEDRLPMILAKVHLTIFALISAIAAVSIFVLFITMKKLTRPIVMLKEGAERIGMGEFGYRINIASGDEMGGLAESFNKMAHNLENLRSMEERLRQAERLAAVGKFAAGIAHEINNPIGNVIGIAKLMGKNYVDNDAREDIETIIKNADRCARITKDLLSYSRQSPPRKEPVSLGALIDDAINTVKHQIRSDNIEITKRLCVNPAALSADPLQISQVLNNILLNAAQSIKGSGSIKIETLAAGDTAEVVITDTGCGMDEDIKDRIFDPFFTTKAVGEGTGLGLAISYGIVRNHGGEIFVESEKGRGSAFRIKLPIGEANG